MKYTLLAIALLIAWALVLILAFERSYFVGACTGYTLGIAVSIAIWDPAARSRDRR